MLDESESTIVEIKERGLTHWQPHEPPRSTIVEIKERGLTNLGSTADDIIYNSRN